MGDSWWSSSKLEQLHCTAAAAAITAPAAGNLLLHAKAHKGCEKVKPGQHSKSALAPRSLLHSNYWHDSLFGADDSLFGALCFSRRICCMQRS